jgi:hypothetical protein
MRIRARRGKLDKHLQPEVLRTSLVLYFLERDT